MIRFTIAFCMIAFHTCGLLAIWNGDEVKEAVPYQVAISRCGNVVAGGSVIGEVLVLTAARPVYTASPKYLKVIAGTKIIAKQASKKAQKKVEVITTHESYHPRSDAYNIAILILVEPVYSDHPEINRIKLAPINQDIGTGTILTIRGWGVYRSNRERGVLRGGTILVKDNVKCKEIYELKKQEYKMDVQFCSTRRHRVKVCHGDVGNPVTNANNEQVGIVSLDTACDHMFPGFFTRTTESTIHKWITDFKNLNQSLLAQ